MPVTANGRPEAPAVPLDGALESVRTALLDLLATAPGPVPKRVALEAGGVRLEVEWPESPVAAAPAATVPEPEPAEPVARDEGHQVRAATVGTFYRRPDPSAPPFVEVGDRVEAGQQVAIVEAMKLMIPVEAPVAGTVTAIHLDDGAGVEFDQPLLAIRTEDSA
ncbi:acetyl-CoA carboxylase biotin carboxyl carrier protein [Spirillospora sp. CA-294931]|uniref:acetyl-CoA carboxylase biotin carboxyl carrier protein n=1 Tax=Spirillospora sp. CA-294931 TaxID=3240042 RepID=UPI003D90C8CC